MISTVSFFSIFFALLIEQARPLPHLGVVHGWAQAWVRVCARNLYAGSAHHGLLLWICAVLLPAGLAWLIYGLLLAWAGWLGAVLAFAWSVAVLYWTLGFRQFSHRFSAIRQALEGGDTALAATLLAKWSQADVKSLTSDRLTPALMNHAVIAAHRHVMAVMVCYAVLAALGLGPAGAVLYRMAELIGVSRPDGEIMDLDAQNMLAPEQAKPTERLAMPSDSSQQLALSAWHWVDYLPARASALAFAVVGDFEEVVDAWRRLLALDSSPSNDALIITAMQASLGAKDAIRPDHLRGLVGLVWRSVVLMLLLIALLSLARLLG
jgi:adenosylcobinamide-phosphate synthase